MINKELERLLANFKYSEFTAKPNYIKIPINELPINEDSMNLVNKIVSLLRSDEHYNETIRTESGGIAIRPLYLMYPSYSYTYNKNYCEILILDEKIYRIQFGTHATVTHVSGRHAFVAFKGYCKKAGIDLTKYQVSEEEGKRIKAEEIPNPSIYIAPSMQINVKEEDIVDRELTICHHLDINSAYPAGVVKSYPEFKDMLEQIYNKRNSSRMVVRKMRISASESVEMKISLGEWNKALMNLSIGFCQSKWCAFKYANIAKAALRYTRDKVDDMVDILVATGRIPLATNTDGIWYMGDQMTNEDLKDYPEHHISNELGDWKHDHRNCLLRFKSVGAYEFYENCIFNEKKEVVQKGKYHAVVRGYTTLDRTKPRETWEWGDIYQKECKVVTFDIDDNGIITQQLYNMN